MSTLNNREAFQMRNHQMLPQALIALTMIAGGSALSKAQEAAPLPASPGLAATVINAPPALTYVQPSPMQMFHHYTLEAFGPYPISGSLLMAGVDQFTNSPPDWRQGMVGYSKRFGSDFGIAATSATARFGLAAAFKEDTLYYRCACSGFFPRLGHALTSTLTARRGADGHRVFSLPSLVAPYAGTMTAVYGWYPSRFGAMDGFRMGNYNLLAYTGGNIALEFFPGGPHSLMHRLHMDNPHDAGVVDSRP